MASRERRIHENAGERRKPQERASRAAKPQWRPPGATRSVGDRTNLSRGAQSAPASANGAHRVHPRTGGGAPARAASGRASQRRAPRSQTSSTAQASTRRDRRRPPPAAAVAEGGAPGGARGKGLDNGANVWYNVSITRKEYVRSWGSKTAHTSYRPRPPRTSKQPARAIIQNAPFCLIAIVGSRSEPSLFGNYTKRTFCTRHHRAPMARIWWWWRACNCAGGYARLTRRSAACSAPKEPSRLRSHLVEQAASHNVHVCANLTASAPCEGF